jgi:hypothetical protein
MKAAESRLKQPPPLTVVSFLAIALFIEVASIVQAIRQDSWAPMYTTGWIPVVVLASYRSANTKGCRQLLRRRAEP